MRSHVDDRDAAGNPIFSRDRPEYYVTTPNGATLLVMVNHFKSKGFVSAQSSDARRHAQAQRAREIYEKRIAEGFDHIALIGDLNDTTDSAPLAPLKENTLQDAFTHPAFDDGAFPVPSALATPETRSTTFFYRRSFSRRSSAAVSSARAPGPEAGRSCGRPIRN
ncbi:MULTISPECIES: hypothetical protein [unclassified Rhizobium]|uniref:hypothetical protein n=1 Tax=unclassified Rhizobium TaxID=2613769 RepID=UPI0010F1A852|nr:MULTISPECIES: hypothetical protein [unclassified Rhizobium]MBB3398386.1 endonuclease/exonuclease/phosphatase family metal-dependent hydrolase [Rhizobium sp. BK060]MBB4166892.1 endonuclease/exonuclease/phosphatase family metal-dependent hydrolase [Rhizobium sp. BK538]TCM67123.1 hypothetical protein EV291_13644 [Rhizobium sp. BK068]